MYNSELIKGQLVKFFDVYSGNKVTDINPLFNKWEQKKQNLMELFGGELIVETELSVSKSDSDIVDMVSSFIDSHVGRYDLGLNEDGMSKGSFISRLLKTVPIDDIRKNSLSLPKEEIVKKYEDFGWEKYVPTNYKQGMKLSRLLSSLCDDDKSKDWWSLNSRNVTYREYFNHHYSMLVQEVNSKGKLCLSIHPMDYLTMSLNKSDWRSCHRPDGEYRAGCCSYMMDEVTIIAYIHSGKKVDYKFGEWNNKSYRQVIYCDAENKTALFSKPYPRQNKEIDTAIRWELGKLLVKNEESKKWKVSHRSKNIHDRFIDEGLHYNDVDRGNSSIIFLESSDSSKRMVIGGDVPCPVCGEGTLERNESFSCDECQKDYYFCIHCDCRIDEDYDDYQVIDGEYYCQSCVDDLFAHCEHCNEWVRNDDSVYIEDVEEYWCNDCRDRHADQCDDCGRWFRNDISSLSAGDICHNCLEDNYYYCEECEDYVANSDWNSEHDMCDECASRIGEEEAV